MAKPRPRLPWWKKSAFAAITCCLFFTALELMLALCGVRLPADADPFVGFDQQSLFVPLASPSDGGEPVLQTRRAKLAWFNDQQFSVKKRPGTLRIFCLGGSTTYGRPYADSTSYVGQLRELLSIALPGRPIEVINCGGVSYASYRLTKVCHEIANYEPDAIVLQTGHNEFLEERTYGAIRQVPAWRRELTRLAARTRTFQLLDRSLGSRGDAPRPATLASEVTAILDHPATAQEQSSPSAPRRAVGLEAYHRDDALRERIVEHFSWNLRRMARIADDIGVPLLLVTPACNLADCEPFKSEPSISAGTAESAEQLVSAQQLLAVGRRPEAIAQLQKLVEQQPRFAAAHYWLGRALLASPDALSADEAVRARRHLLRAIEEDVCPLRAIDPLVKAMHDVTGDHVRLVDFRGLLEDDCRRRHGHTCVGQAYFLDHVHPRVHWHGALAKQLAAELADMDVISINTADLETAGAAVDQWAERQLTPERRGSGLRNLAKVLNWAGKHLEAGELALEACRILPNDPEANLLAAGYLREFQRLDEAIEHARRATWGSPVLADACRLYALLLGDAQRWQEAEAAARVWLNTSPQEASAHELLGIALANQQRWPDALTELRQAEQNGIDSPRLRAALAIATHHVGDLATAAKRYRALLDASFDADLSYNYALLLIEQQRTDEAKQLLAALSADHIAPEMRQAASELLEQLNRN
ncbi:MAG: tetratricopeptide repeat protein [Planctomycetales bacterium]|nr:tetratricopeptide repeat protein [Planctomycetales bacterium]